MKYGLHLGLGALVCGRKELLMLTDFVVIVASLPLRRQSRSYAASSDDSESH
jgi:hypothetical protein